jgi:hypothetical protein
VSVKAEWRQGRRAFHETAWGPGCLLMHMASDRDGWGLTSCVFYGYNAFALDMDPVGSGSVRDRIVRNRGMLGEGWVRTVKGLFSRDC